MGDRSVIGIKDNTDAPTLYLYSHYDGSDRYQRLMDAIDNASVRAGDDSYFTRIFISTLVGDLWNQETGYGLSVNWFTMPDYPDIPVLNLAEKSLEIYRGDRHDDLTLIGTIELLDLRSPDHGPDVVMSMVANALEETDA